MPFKDAPLASDITGEDFMADLPNGFKNLTGQERGGPYVRFLPHIEARDKMINGLPQGQGNYRPYDDTDTVNQS